MPADPTPPPPMVVKSRHSLMLTCDVASAAPRIQTGSFAQSLATRSLASTTAPPPSVRRHTCFDGEGIGEHRCSRHVGHGDAIALEGVVVHGRPLVRCDRDLGQLVHGGAELDHVPPGRHRVLGDQRRTVGRLVLHGATGAHRRRGAAHATLDVRTGGRPVRQQGDVDLTGRDGRGGVPSDDLPRRSADVGGIDPRRTQAEVLADFDGRQQRPVRRRTRRCRSLVRPASATARRED